MAVGRADLGPPPALGVGRGRLGRRAGERLGHRAGRGSIAARSNGSGGGGITSAHPAVTRTAGADVEVGAQRPGDLLGEERARAIRPVTRRTTSPTQVAVVERVVARGRAGLPPRRLGGEQGGGLLPVVQVLEGERLVPARHARGVRHEVADEHAAPCRWPANSGQYAATGASRSSCPRSASISAASAVIVLVVDQTLTMVSAVQGVAPVHRRGPPQRSTTVSPSRSTAMAPPSSSWVSSWRSSSSRTRVNRSSQLPCTSATAGLLPAPARRSLRIKAPSRPAGRSHLRRVRIVAPRMPLRVTRAGRADRRRRP